MMGIRARVAGIVLVLCAAACGGNHSGSNGDGGAGDGGGGGDGGVVCINGLQSITLTPATTTLTIDGVSTPPTVTFTASGHYADGHDADIPGNQLAWTATRADQTDPGTITAGVYAPNPQAGGLVTVTATDGCVTSGPATVEIDLNAVVGTPQNPGDWTGTPVDTGGATIVYPSDQTRFPRNIYRTLFQWRTSGFTQFRLIFTGPYSTVTIYTDGVHADCAAATPAAGCWEADETTWSYIAASNAGATATWTVDALDTSTTTPTVRRAGPITIGFSKQDVSGAIFYWSTTSAGVRRAAISAQYPEDYIAGKPATTYPDGTTVKCVACHVVSRDGKYLVAPVDASSGQSVWITEVTMAPPPTPLVKMITNTKGHGFATVSNDDEHVVVAFGGLMWMVKRVDGSKEQDIPLGSVKGTQPDWSPTEDLIAFAGAGGDAPGNAPLDTIAWMGGTTWGAIKTIVPPDGLSNLFPAFSPDGAWIAYARGKGGHDDKTAQLWIVDKDGTGSPVELVNANRVVSNGTTTDTTGQHQNSQPTWGPSGDYMWVAFNSMRAYGVVRPAAIGHQQIWVAAIDPSKLGTGADPSFPAFRLQFQGLDEDNHRAYWTEDVRDNPPPPPPPSDGGVCIAHGQTCDPAVDTCCDVNDVCDSTDNGMTYTCITRVN